MHSLMSNYLHTLVAQYLAVSVTFLTMRPSVICISFPFMSVSICAAHLNHAKVLYRPTRTGSCTSK